MPKMRKRLERLLNNPIANWPELVTILKYYGCDVRECDGSHKVITPPDSNQIVTVPVHNNQVKKIYVKKIIKLIEEVIENGGSKDE